MAPLIVYHGIPLKGAMNVAYVINPTGRSRRRRCGCGCGGCHGGPWAYEPSPYCRNVIYNGPCPPDPDSPCQPPLPPPPPDPPCYTSPMGPMACAYYAQLGSLTVPNAGGVLPLNTIEQGNQSVFLNNDGQITILRPGTYRAQFALSIPPGAAVNTTLSMTLNGVPLPDASVGVSGGSGNACLFACFQVTQPGAVLAITSSAPFSIADNGCGTLASLNITQTGPLCG